LGAPRIRQTAEWLPLGVALGVVALAQVSELRAGGSVWNADTASYVQAAQHVARGDLFDPWRTPAYPALLTLVGTGSALVAVQAAVLVLLPALAYLLSQSLTKSRLIGALCAALIGGNLAFLQWERVVGTEAVATGLAALLVATFALAAAKGRGWLATFLVVGLVAILLRPAFLLAPLLLGSLLVVHALLDRRWQAAVVVLFGVALLYGGVAGYAVVNANRYPGAGFTAVTNLNTFTKVLEYRMTGDAAPAFGDFAPPVAAYRAAGRPDPFWFADHYPDLIGRYFARAMAMSESAIRHEPAAYIRGIVGQLPDAWLDSSAPTQSPSLLSDLGALVSELAVRLLLITVPLSLVRFLSAPRDWRALIVLATALLTAEQIIFNAVAAPFDFDRLRAPVEPLAILLAVTLWPWARGRYLSRRTVVARKVRRGVMEGDFRA
jgi:hypothetical protein